MSTSSQINYVNGIRKPVSLTSDNDMFYSTQQQLKGGGSGDMATMSEKEVSFHSTTSRKTVVSRSRWATEDGGFGDCTFSASSEAPESFMRRRPTLSTALSHSWTFS
ncbi:unnamed protein product [Microthlaspi erraticum]|uniref:Uncharacterized protein n=1 Tax=Microthlaspi erraticum TaxID=1685480 RepID=A0A6D2KAX5_9BRAS|nr:unnamed protein product [Microthlaspi erraticum]